MLQSRHLNYRACSGSSLVVTVNTLSQVLECGFTVLTTMCCVLNRPSLLPEVLYWGMESGRGSCEQAVNTILCCELTLPQIRAVQYGK